jgi:hypothetical protein
MTELHCHAQWELVSIGNLNIHECMVKNAILLTNIMLSVSWTIFWRQLKSSGMRSNSAATCSSLQWTVLHSCSAQVKDRASVGNFFGFDWAVFNTVVSHHFKILGVSRVTIHGFGLA